MKFHCLREPLGESATFTAGRRQPRNQHADFSAYFPGANRPGKRRTLGVRAAIANSIGTPQKTSGPFKSSTGMFDAPLPVRAKIYNRRLSAFSSISPIKRADQACTWINAH